MTDLLCGLFFGLGGAVCHKTDDKTDGGGADPAETEARKGQNATDRFDDAIEVACGAERRAGCAAGHKGRRSA